MQDDRTGLGLASRLADEIRTLASRALAHGLGAAAAREARARVRRPIEYMRHAEFEAVLRWLVRHVQRVNAAVYERAAGADTFYAREYDRAQLDALLAGSPLALVAQSHIRERDGPLALDAIGWGPRRGRMLSRLALKLVVGVERIARADLECLLAQRHLRLSAAPQPRLVNIGLRLERR